MIMKRMRKHNSRSGRRAFSVVEMLIALAISGSLMAATLAALDSSFKQYKSTTESASTHVVSRIVMHRMLSMIRTGTDFGPFPADPLDPDQNPISSEFIEFVSEQDIGGGITRITRIEHRPSVEEGPNDELWYVVVEPTGEDETIVEERLLLSGVIGCQFNLEYNEQSWLLDRATIDLTIEPNDSADLTIGGEAPPQTIRLVASAAPRQTR